MGEKIRRKCYIMGNQRNPTSKWTGVAHAAQAENWMGPILSALNASSFKCFNSQCFSYSSSVVTMPALMDRLLSAQWHQLRVPSVQNWLPIGSHFLWLAKMDANRIFFFPPRLIERWATMGPASCPWPRQLQWQPYFYQHSHCKNYMPVDFLNSPGHFHSLTCSQHHVIIHWQVGVESP